MQKKWIFTNTTPSGVQLPYFPEGFWPSVVHKVEDAKPKKGEGTEPKGFWITVRPHPQSGLDVSKHEARIYGAYDDSNGITMSILLAAMASRGWTVEMMQAQTNGFDLDPVTQIPPGTVFYIECQPNAREDDKVKGKFYHNTNVYHDVGEWQKRKAEWEASKRAAAAAGTQQAVTQAPVSGPAGVPLPGTAASMTAAPATPAVGGLPGAAPVAAPVAAMPGVPVAGAPGVVPNPGLPGLPGLPGAENHQTSVAPAGLPGLPGIALPQ